MKTKLLYLIILIFSIFSIGCSSSDVLHSNKKKEKQTSDIITSKEFEYLKSSNSVAESSQPFTQVKAFIPDKSYLDYQNVKGEKFTYIKLSKKQLTIKGTIILENNTKKSMNIQSSFIQGNKIAKVKTRHSKQWKTSFLYDVKPKSSVKIKVDIQWDKKGLKELTFFPIDNSSSIDRYNGGNLSTFRYFVLDNDLEIDNKKLKNQTFKLDSKIDLNSQEFLPIPSWIGKDKHEVKYIEKDNKLLTKSPITGLKLNSVPYDTKVDVLLMDKQGNLSVVIQKVKVKKNKPTYIFLSSEVLSNLEKTSNKNYAIILNNRGEDILLDIKSLDLGRKPFSTTYQTVIEFYKCISS